MSPSRGDHDAVAIGHAPEARQAGGQVEAEGHAFRRGALRSDLAHDRQLVEVTGQADVVVAAVDAGKSDGIRAGRTGAAGLGVALGQRIGGAIGAGGDDPARVGIGGAPGRQHLAVVDEDPVALPARLAAVDLADQLHRRRIPQRGARDGGAVTTPDRADGRLLRGVSGRQAEAVTALLGAIQRRARGIGLVQTDQARAAAVVDRQPQHRLGSRRGPHRQAQGGDEVVDLCLVEADDQGGAEGRCPGRTDALVLAVVVAAHEVPGAAQFLSHARLPGHAAAAGDPGQHGRQGTGKTLVALGLALAVDRDFRLVRPLRAGAIALDALRGGGEAHQQQCRQPEPSKCANHCCPWSKEPSKWCRTGDDTSIHIGRGW